MIYESVRARRRLGKLPVEVLKRYEKWKDVLRYSGINGLRKIKGFKDEALSGKWKGYRSSRLNIQYRVIYMIEAKEIVVYVEDITPHDYRRK